MRVRLPKPNPPFFWSYPTSQIFGLPLLLALGLGVSGLLCYCLAGLFLLLIATKKGNMSPKRREQRFKYKIYPQDRGNSGKCKPTKKAKRRRVGATGPWRGRQPPSMPCSSLLASLPAVLFSCPLQPLPAVPLAPALRLQAQVLTPETRVKSRLALSTHHPLQKKPPLLKRLFVPNCLLDAHKKILKNPRLSKKCDLAQAKNETFMQDENEGILENVSETQKSLGRCFGEPNLSDNVDF